MNGYDPGVQRERTAMAWTRTGVSVLVNGLIVLRAGAVANQFVIVVLGFVLLAASGAAVVVGAWRARHLSAGRHETTPWPLVLATVWIAWLASIGGIWAIAAS